MSFRNGDTKLEINTSSLLITDAEEAQIKSFLSWYKNLKSASAIRKVKDDSRPEVQTPTCTATNAPTIIQKPWIVHPPGPFRIMDLPPELRLRIYTQVFEVDQPEGWQLPTMAFPSITRVSQLIRKESLPAFFNEAKFKISVASNVWRWFPQSDRRWYMESNHVGVLHLNQKVKKAMQAAGKDVAMFKDVEFVLCRHWNKRFAERGVPDEEVVAIVRLWVCKGRLTVDIVRGRAWPDEPGEETETHYRRSYRVFEHMLEDVRDLANEVSRSGKDFKGFFYKDLAKIAKGFNCKRGSYGDSEDDD